MLLGVDDMAHIMGHSCAIFFFTSLAAAKVLLIPAIREQWVLLSGPIFPLTVAVAPACDPSSYLSFLPLLVSLWPCAPSLSVPCFFADSSSPKHPLPLRPRRYPAFTQEPLEHMVLPLLPKLQSFWAQPLRR